MDRNRFNAEVRPHLTEIPIGIQGIGFDRLELDAWVDDYKSRNGRPATERRQVMGRKRVPGLIMRAGIWHIDKRIFGRRVCQSTGTARCNESDGCCSMSNDPRNAADNRCNVADGRCILADERCSESMSRCEAADDGCNAADDGCNATHDWCNAADSRCNVTDSH